MLKELKSGGKKSRRKVLNLVKCQRTSHSSQHSIQGDSFKLDRWFHSTMVKSI